MEHTYFVAAQWLLLALLASLFSVRLGISVALIEILCGILGGYFLKIEITPWVTFLASFGAVVLTFLAGAEIDPRVLRERFWESAIIGFFSFLLPFLGAMAYAYYIAGWDANAAKIAGVALSTTSVAVVYAVMVETGLSSTRLGQAILAACFITDLGTVIALGLLFTGFTWKIGLFAVIVGLAVYLATPLARTLFDRYGGKVSEPEIKFVFLVLAVLGWVAIVCGSEAVLPAYILGMAMAGFFGQYKQTLHKMRAIVFAAFTPFYFIKAGALVSVPALAAFPMLIAVLLVVKVAAKFIGVLPATRVFNYSFRTGMYTTLLMSTGLTFGTISALYGYTQQYISQDQYSILVVVVILSAVVPTMIAQKFFLPVPLRPATEGTLPQQETVAAPGLMETK